jgi:putative hydrolase of the HAD superfamily
MNLTKRTLPAVLLLDMDDTILDNTGARDDAWRQACVSAAEAHPGLDVEALYREVERVREIVWSDPEWHREWRMKVREAWGQIGGEAVAALGIDEPELGQLIGDRHFELRDAAIAPLPGALEALHRLRELEVRLGLITNGASAGQREKIERFALAAHFDYIGIEEEVGFGKPHPDAYQAALASLEATQEETWMVGDNLEWDVAGAQAVGIFGIWLDKTGAGLPKDSATQPDRIVRSIGELVPERYGNAPALRRRSSSFQGGRIKPDEKVGD